MKFGGSKKSIFRKILVPILILMLVEFGLLYFMFLLGGTSKQMNDNALAFFDQTVSSGGITLQADMIRRWSNLDESVSAIDKKTKAYLKDNRLSYSDLKFQSKESENLILTISEDIIYLLRKNAVTGAFLLLEGDVAQKKDGIYFCDPNPENNPVGNSDLLSLRGAARINKSFSVAMDSSWKPYFDFRGVPISQKAFYENPMSAAKKGLEAADGEVITNSDFGYWSPAFKLAASSKSYDDTIVTYSLPLFTEQGEPFAVLGIEMNTDRIASKVNANELAYGPKSGYILASKNEVVSGGSTAQGTDDRIGEYTVSAVTGGYLKSIFANKKTFAIDSEKSLKTAFRLSEKSSPLTEEFYVSIKDITLYNTNTPFENDKWVLIGVAPEDGLFVASDKFSRLLLTLLLAVIPIGLAGVFVVAKIISMPILRLSKRLKNNKRDAFVSIGKIDISEIDSLIDSIEFFSRQAENSAFRLSKILEMTGTSIGAFEYSGESTVFCTNGLLRLLEIESDAFGLNKGGFLGTSEFDSRLLKLFQNSEERYSEIPTSEGANDVCLFESKSGNKWLRVRTIKNQGGVLGVITDITQELLERKRIEHDRDFDLLTNIYNRRAFRQNASELFAPMNREKLKIAGMVMIDIDNLKYINDTYGHDYGDEYICATANVLSRFHGDGYMYARQSGDEFNLLIYGKDTKQEIREILSRVKEAMKDERIKLPDGTSIQVRASAGIAWYPDDADSYDVLLRYADFAMYFIKKNRKGDFTEFSLENYNKNSYLLSCREELNKLIEQSLVDYHFQPIVDASTGEIFGYEALMRPRTPTIKAPDELLMLAHMNSKLSQIEKLTLYCAMEEYKKLSHEHKSKKLFINSIANQIMSDEDIDVFYQKNKDYLDNVVIEVTETEDSEFSITEAKKALISRWNMQIALDDYGSGYNGETVLLKLLPQYVKIDLYFVRDIQLDKNKLEMVRSFIKFAHDRGIKVIAEGVEYEEEMRALISEGIDYVQGYYLARPAPVPPKELPSNLVKKIKSFSGLA